MKREFRLVEKEYEFNNEKKSYFVIEKRIKILFFWDDWEKIGTNYRNKEEAEKEFNWWVKAYQKEDIVINNIVLR